MINGALESKLLRSCGAKEQAEAEMEEAAVEAGGGQQWLRWLQPNTTWP